MRSARSSPVWPRAPSTLVLYGRRPSTSATNWRSERSVPRPGCDLQHVAHTCSGDGISTDSRDCVEEDLICQPGRGCVLCTPSQVRCEEIDPGLCEWRRISRSDACDASVGEYCSALGCAPLCAQAEQDSYIGCEYWPTTVFNPAIRSDFEYAVVVANPQLVPAEITIQLGAQTVRQVQVGPGSLDTIRLPWGLISKTEAKLT